MSKKNIKPKKYSFYRKYKIDRNDANAWNDMQYQTCLIMDEGRPKPPPQRLTNFIFKYGMKHKKTGKSILSYIPEEMKEKILEWVSFTTFEKNNVRRISKQEFGYNIDKKINGWLHQAEIMYLEDIRKS